MRRWIRLLPLLITALWLPLQAVTAVAMPYCRHAAGHGVPADVAAAGEHCAGHGVDTAAGAAATADQDCDGCELCHLASAGYMLATQPQAAQPSVARDFEPLPALAASSFIPEPPQHPPRRLN